MDLTADVLEPAAANASGLAHSFSAQILLFWDYGHVVHTVQDKHIDLW